MWRSLAAAALAGAGACAQGRVAAPTPAQRSTVLVCESTRGMPRGIECNTSTPTGVRCLLARVTSAPDPLGKFMMVVEHVGEPGAVLNAGSGDPSLLCSSTPDPSMVVVFDTTSVVGIGHPAADRSVRCLLVQLRPRTDAGLRAVAVSAFWGTTYNGGIECPTQDKTSPVVLDTLTIARPRETARSDTLRIPAP